MIRSRALRIRIGKSRFLRRHAPPIARRPAYIERQIEMKAPGPICHKNYGIQTLRVRLPTSAKQIALSEAERPSILEEEDLDLLEEENLMAEEEEEEEEEEEV